MSKARARLSRDRLIRTEDVIRCCAVCAARENLAPLRELHARLLLLRCGLLGRQRLHFLCGSTGLACESSSLERSHAIDGGVMMRAIFFYRGGLVGISLLVSQETIFSTMIQTS